MFQADEGTGLNSTNTVSIIMLKYKYNLSKPKCLTGECHEHGPFQAAEDQMTGLEQPVS